MEFERKRAKTREERLRERRLSKLERKEERLLEEKMERYVYLCDLADRIAEQS